MKTKIATDIPLSIFYNILHFAKNNNWQIISEYPNLFDKGIDIDYYHLKKDNQNLLMHWDIWFQGEIKADESTFIIISNEIDYQFTFGQSIHFNKYNLE